MASTPLEDLNDRCGAGGVAWIDCREQQQMGGIDRLHQLFEFDRDRHPPKTRPMTMCRPLGSRAKPGRRDRGVVSSHDPTPLFRRTVRPIPMWPARKGKVCKIIDQMAQDGFSTGRFGKNQGRALRFNGRQSLSNLVDADPSDTQQLARPQPDNPVSQLLDAARRRTSRLQPRFHATVKMANSSAQRNLAPPAHNGPVSQPLKVRGRFFLAVTGRFAGDITPRRSRAAASPFEATLAVPQLSAIG